MTTKSIYNQSRWNDYGKKRLKELKKNPQNFILDKSPLDKTPYFKRIFELFNSSVRGFRIMELGCGTGDVAVYLARQGAKVAAVDVGRNLIASAKLLAKINEVEIDCKVANVTQLPFESSSFTHVTSISLLHHLSPKDLLKTVNEAKRVLKNGGYFLCNEPIEDSKLFDFIQNLFPVSSNMGNSRPSILQRKKWKTYISKIDERALTTKELKNAVCDFSEVKIFHNGLFGRLDRFFPNLSSFFVRIDDCILLIFPFLKRYSRNLVICAKK